MLFILGVVAIVVFAIQVYKSAASTGRNAVGWVTVTVAVGIGIQFGLPIFVGLIYGVYLAILGPPVELEPGFFGLMGVIGVAGIILSIVGMWLVARHVCKVRDEDSNVQPPPPPIFG